jgi:predicted ferric reductase
MKAVRWIAPILFVANLLVILWIWHFGFATELQEGWPGWVILLGRLAGLVAFYLALWQMLLIGRVGWIERPYGHDRLSRLHHANARVLITILFFHPILIIIGHAAHHGLGVVEQFLDFFNYYPGVLWAVVAWLTFMAIFCISITVVRRRLPYEWWHTVHFLMYAAIILAFLHQYQVGPDLVAGGSQRYWFGLAGVVALNVLYYRFFRPVWRSWYFGYRVTRVVAEAATVTSVYIGGRRLGRLPVRAGQFVMVRFLARPWIWQEHPFSLSQAPNGRELRLTIKNIGDFTATVGNIPVGTRVLVEGPLGRFTSERIARPKALLIAGGIGITPLRALFEELAQAGRPVDLIYSARTQADFALQKELNALATPAAQIHYVPEDAMGRVSADIIRRYAPDVAERDVLVCGPPLMMEALVEVLLGIGVPRNQIHYEKFRLG